MRSILTFAIFLTLSETFLINPASALKPYPKSFDGAFESFQFESCNQTPVEPSNPFIDQVLKPLDEMADVCPVYTEAEIVAIEKNRLKLNYPKPAITRTVFGVEVTGDPDLLIALEESLKPEPRPSPIPKPDDKPTEYFPRLTSRWQTTLKPECKGEAVCLFSALVNNEAVALKILNFKASTGFTVSVAQASDPGQPNPPSTFWSLKEVQTIEQSMKQLSNSTLETLKKSFFGFHRQPSNWNWQHDDLRINGAALSTIWSSKNHIGKLGRIILNDDTFNDNSKPTIADMETVLHELGHQVDRNRTAFSDLQIFSDSPTYTQDFESLEFLTDGYVSYYAQSSKAEDIAESSAAYWLLPNLLKNRSANKHERISSEIQKPYMGESKLNKLINPSILPTQDALALTCLKNIYAITRNESARPIFWESTGVGTQLNGRDLTEWTLNTSCFHDLAVELAQEAKGKTPDFCKNGGIATLERALLNKAISALDPVLRTLEKCIAQASTPVDKTACGKAADLPISSTLKDEFSTEISRIIATAVGK